MAAVATPAAKMAEVRTVLNKANTSGDVAG